MSIPIILSGEQLVHASSKTKHELPTGGLKDFQPTNSWLEKKQIQSALDERKDLLEEERVEKWSCLMRAEWSPDKAKAVVKHKTKSWEVFGHNSDNTDWLFPEEIVFLLELNCLECTYNKVPLSIQKSCSVLLGEKNGCSLTEYRVYSHLSRLGYRVVRHLPDLTVTAYEKQIRLDCHMDQRTTYQTSSETLQPLETDSNSQNLQENLNNNLNETEEIKVASKNADKATIEVIDIVDSSEESSDSEPDSDIEVLYEVVGAAEVIEGITEISDSEDEIGVVEVPIPPKQIEVATIESSDSEKQDENSGSESERSYDGNWKRNSRNRRNFVRPPTMSNLKFLAVEEFCRENPKAETLARNQQNSTFGEGSNAHSSTSLNTDLSSSASSRPFFKVGRSRNSILDMIPSMASKNQKLMTIECPDFRLIPDNVIPKQQMYTFNTNSLRARFFDPSRFANRGRRNFNGSRFNNYNVFAQNSNSGIYPNQIQTLSPLLQGNSLLQMLNGSDVHSMARGMMQIASAILLNSPVNNFSNGYNTSSNPQTFQSRGFNASRFNRDDRRNMYLERQHRDSYRVRPNHFQENPPNHILPRFSAPQIQPAGNYINFDMPLTTENFLHSNQRNSTTPVLSDVNLAVQRNRSRSPNRTTQLNSRQCLPSTSSHNVSNFLPLDPAYIKSDVPVQGIKYTKQENGNFIPFRSIDRKPIEIVELGNDNVVPKKGISGRFNRKRRRKQERKQMAKRFRMNQNIKKDPLEIIFLDSPDSSNQNVYTVNNPVKQEDNNSSQASVKTEPDLESSTIKQESSISRSEEQVKKETPEFIKCENNVENTPQTSVKQEEQSGVRVTLDNSGANFRVEITIETQSDTSSVRSIPLDSVKSEHTLEVKSEQTEMSSELVKTEPLNNTSTCVKVESSVDDIPTENEVSSLDTSSTVALHENRTNQNCKLDTAVTSIATDTKNTMDIVSEMETDNDEALNHSSVEATCPNQCTLEIIQDNNKAAISTTNVTSGDVLTVSDCNLIQSNVSDIVTQVNRTQQEIATSTKLNILDATNKTDISTENKKLDDQTEDDHNQQSKNVSEMEVEAFKSISQFQDNVNNEADISTTKVASGDVETLSDCKIVQSIVSDIVTQVNESQPEIVTKQNIGDKNIADISMNNVTSGDVQTVDNCTQQSNGVCEMEVDVINSNSQTQDSTANLQENTVIETRIGESNNQSSWAQMKSNKEALQPKELQEDSNSDVDEDEISPLIRTKHCKTVGNVLSKLQMFAPFSPKLPSDLSKLKISFDLYLPAAFRKSHRGLPHFRISVFEGTEMLPSAAQLHELQHRFSDGASVLCAVVMPGSVVFYACSDISPRVDITSIGTEMLPSAAQLHELQHRFSDGVSVLCAVVMPGSVVFYACSDVSLPVDITSYASEHHL